MNLDLAARLQLTTALCLALTGTLWGGAAAAAMLLGLTLRARRRPGGSAAGAGVLATAQDPDLLDPAGHPGGGLAQPA